MSQKNKGTFELEKNELVVDPEAFRNLREDQWAALLKSSAFKEAVKEIALETVTHQVRTRSGSIGRALRD